MKRHTVRQRLAAFLLAALMSLSWLPPLPAFAENTPMGLRNFLEHWAATRPSLCLLTVPTTTS